MGSDAEARTAAAAPRIATGDRLSAILARGQEATPSPPRRSRPRRRPTRRRRGTATDGEARPDEPPPEDKPADEAKPDPAAAAVHGRLEAARAGRCSCAGSSRRSAPSRTTTARLRRQASGLDPRVHRAAPGGQARLQGSRGRTGFLRQELLIDAIGADTLADDRKLQRSQEHTDRRWRLGQQLQAASKGDAASHRTAVRRRPARLLGDRRHQGTTTRTCNWPPRSGRPRRRWRWTSGSGGKCRPGASSRRATTPRPLARHPTRQPVLPTQGRQDHQDPARRHLPGTGDHADQSLRSSGQPGQLKADPVEGTGPKAASAPPPTLSARQAAAPPSAKAPSDGSPRVIVDPHDPANRAARIAAAIAKRQQG